ncbi:motile sperm domain-containing protein 1 [Spodoptera frugiperda]|uniref:Motile sperm domain-containing protein 1 n=1 Tax=Spodoptera frugiperda TaxID=7108 RepID=A0A9R0D2G5_SPOFR|nr:motile sperm domain-containing protein 1 [Spodoptera frugiperda]
MCYREICYCFSIVLLAKYYLKMKNLPVFVFPVALEFYLSARHTHKQLLTVYNPYEFPVNLKVLCTSPKKFTVIDPEGVIAPQSCIDIVVRYTQTSQTHCDSIEKFRITMFDKNTQQVLGKRDILTKLIEGEPSNISQECLGDDFHPLTMRPAPLRSTEEVSRMAPCTHPSHREQQPVNVVAVAVSICCIAALLLPTQPEEVMKSQWPDWLHIGSNLKLVFSFVLGLVCMLVLRP